jgi:hypothetical protein
MNATQPSDGDLIHIVPTILYRMERGLQAAATVEPEAGRALLVFRNEEEAEKFRADTGKHSEAEGWGPVALDLGDLQNVLKMHECTHVAMPEEWTGEGGVDFFEASDFIGMLEESVRA